MTESTTASGAADALRSAMNRAFNLGQIYLQQADSDSYAEQDKSRSTYKKYKALLEETCTTLAASAPAPQQEPTNAVLLKFYGVETDVDLIAAQAAHIEKLQAKLQPTPSFAPQQIRKG